MGIVRIFVDDEESHRRHFHQAVAQTCATAKAQNRRAGLSLSGGSVAEKLLPGLSDVPSLRETLDVFWCDERAVPLDDELSNYRAARELWLKPAGFGGDQVFPLKSEPSLEEAAQNYEALLRSRASQGSSPLDLVLLGMGPDGHVASLFPESASLSSSAWIEPIYDSPKPPPQRLTMTLPLLLQAPLVILGVFGSSKASSLELALLEKRPLPVTHVLERAERVHLLLDAEAAAGLPSNLKTERDWVFEAPSP